MSNQTKLYRQNWIKVQTSRGQTDRYRPDQIKLGRSNLSDVRQNAASKTCCTYRDLPYQTRQTIPDQVEKSRLGINSSDQSRRYCIK